MWLQIKYREAGKQAASSCLYSKLPETMDTRHAKEASQLQSQVTCGARNTTQGAGRQSSSLWTSWFQPFSSTLQVKYKQEVGGSLYQQLPETAEMQLAKELRAVYSQVRRSLPPTQHTLPPVLVCVTAALVLR